MKRPAAFTQTWWQDRGLTTMLVCLGIGIFLAPIIEVVGIVDETFFKVVMSLVLVSGVIAISGRGAASMAMGLMALLTLLLKWAHFVFHGSVLGAAADAFAMLSIVLLTTLVLQHVFRAGPITPDRIRGAIVAYLLVGFFFFEAYQLVSVFRPEAFHVEDGSGGVKHLHALAYFSFVTLTTVGYGDITASDPIARSLAVGEALIGQLYPAILIGGLVSMHLASRDRA
ncbi:MAG TPA: potassium channel family protein [Thermoanaerobaculia bacterium]|nr:potassium channel family protein [Thermoanaerobaculia bacterium]